MQSDAASHKFLGNLPFILAANVLIKPFWILVVDRSVQNQLGAEAYGLFYSLNAFSYLFTILLDFGINNYNNTVIARHSQLLQKYFSGIITLKAILTVLYLVFSLVWAVIIGYQSQSLELGMLLCFNQVLISIIAFFRSNIAALQYFKTDSLVSVLDRTILIFLIGGWLISDFADQLTITWFILAQTFAYLITTGIAFWSIRPHLEHIRFNFKPGLLRLILKRSAPFALLTLLMVGYTRLDVILLERLLPDGQYQSGLYAACYRLLDAVNMIGVVIAGVLLPLFSKQFALRESTQPLAKLGFGLLVIPSLILLGAGITWGEQIMQLLSPDLPVQKAGLIFGLLMANSVPVCINYVYGTLLTAHQEVKWLNGIAAGGLMLNLAINIIFIPSQGALSCAIAALITQLLVAFLQTVVSYRKFNFHFRWLQLMKSSLFFILIPGLFLLWKYCWPETWLWSLPTISIAALILAIMLGILQPAQLKALIPRAKR